ncbi:MAG: hypothetical protein IVW54_02315 [Candidatus Binataceae bacterium]|nr:hypothetical protein [Candidatus Binataceae bacterium]
MKLLRDPLRRPIKRLYFKTEELDERCEWIITEFMDHRSGGFRLPIPTDDIIRMIEAEADDLDLYAEIPESVDGCLPVPEFAKAAEAIQRESPRKHSGSGAMTSS